MPKKLPAHYTRPGTRRSGVRPVEPLEVHDRSGVQLNARNVLSEEEHESAKNARNNYPGRMDTGEDESELFPSDGEDGGGSLYDSGTEMETSTVPAGSVAESPLPPASTNLMYAPTVSVASVDPTVSVDPEPIASGFDARVLLEAVRLGIGASDTYSSNSSFSDQEIFDSLSSNPNIQRLRDNPSLKVTWDRLRTYFRSSGKRKPDPSPDDIEPEAKKAKSNVDEQTRLTTARADDANRITQLLADLTKARSTIDDLTRQSAGTARLKQKIARLKTDLDQERKRSRALSITVESQKLSLDAVDQADCKNKLAKALSDFTQKDRELKAALADVVQLQADQKNLQDRFDMQTQELVRVERRADASLGVIRTKNAEIKTLTDNKTALEATIKTQQDTLAGNARLIRSETARGNSFMDKISTLEARIDELRNKLEARDITIRAKNGLIASYVQAIDDAKAELKTSQDATAALQANKLALEGQVTAQEAALITFQENSALEIQALQARLRDAQNELRVAREAAAREAADGVRVAMEAEEEAPEPGTREAIKNLVEGLARARHKLAESIGFVGRLNKQAWQQAAAFKRHVEEAQVQWRELARLVKGSGDQVLESYFANLSAKMANDSDWSVVPEFTSRANFINSTSKSLVEEVKSWDDAAGTFIRLHADMARLINDREWANPFTVTTAALPPDQTAFLNPQLPTLGPNNKPLPSSATSPGSMFLFQPKASLLVLSKLIEFRTERNRELGQQQEQTRASAEQEQAASEKIRLAEAAAEALRKELQQLKTQKVEVPAPPDEPPPWEGDLADLDNFRPLTNLEAADEADVSFLTDLEDPAALRQFMERQADRYAAKLDQMKGVIDQKDELLSRYEEDDCETRLQSKITECKAAQRRLFIVQAQLNMLIEMMGLNHSQPEDQILNAEVPFAHQLFSQQPMEEDEGVLQELVTNVAERTWEPGCGEELRRLGEAFAPPFEDMSVMMDKLKIKRQLRNPVEPVTVQKRREDEVWLLAQVDQWTTELFERDEPLELQQVSDAWKDPATQEGMDVVAYAKEFLRAREKAGDQTSATGFLSTVRSVKQHKNLYKNHLYAAVFTAFKQFIPPDFKSQLEPVCNETLYDWDKVVLNARRMRARLYQVWSTLNRSERYHETQPESAKVCASPCQLTEFLSAQVTGEKYARFTLGRPSGMHLYLDLVNLLSFYGLDGSNSESQEVLRGWSNTETRRLKHLDTQLSSQHQELQRASGHWLKLCPGDTFTLSEVMALSSAFMFAPIWTNLLTNLSLAHKTGPHVAAATAMALSVALRKVAQDEPTEFNERSKLALMLSDWIKKVKAGPVTRVLKTFETTPDNRVKFSEGLMKGSYGYFTFRKDDSPPRSDTKVMVLSAALPHNTEQPVFYYAPVFHTTQIARDADFATAVPLEYRNIFRTISYESMARLVSWLEMNMSVARHRLRFVVNEHKPRCLPSDENPVKLQGLLDQTFTQSQRLNELSRISAVQVSELKNHTDDAALFPQGKTTALGVCAVSKEDALKQLQTMVRASWYTTRVSITHTALRVVVLSDRNGLPVPQLTTQEIRDRLGEQGEHLYGCDSKELERHYSWHDLALLLYWCRMLSLSPRYTVGINLSPSEIHEALVTMVQEMDLAPQGPSQLKGFSLDGSEQPPSMPFELMDTDEEE